MFVIGLNVYDLVPERSCLLDKNESVVCTKRTFCQESVIFVLPENLLTRLVRFAIFINDPRAIWKENVQKRLC